MTDPRIIIRQQYKLLTGRDCDTDLARYADYLELKLTHAEPLMNPNECPHPFEKVISAGTLHHCCQCKTDIKPKK